MPKPVTPARRLRHLAEYLFVRTAACALAMLTPRQTKAIAEAAAGLMTRLPARLVRRDLARENLRSAFPHASDAWIDETVRAMWTHLFRMTAEIVQFPRKVVLENCREVLVFRNRAASVAAACSGRPVIVLGGHFGNWEASMTTFGTFSFPMGVVARELDNPLLNDWLSRSRQATGHRLIWKRGAGEAMLAQLAAGGSLAMLCDQDAGRRGVFCDFFGRPASTHKSLALLALEHDALIVCGYGRRLPDDFRNGRWARFEIGCEDVIDPRECETGDPVGEITRRYTAALERSVRRSPEQYFWVHRRWKTPVGAKRKRRLKKAA